MRRLLVSLLPPLLVLPLTGCRGAELGPNEVVYCTVMADPPETDAAAQTIRGPGWFVCDRPGPDTLTLTVALQQRDATGAWVTVRSQQFVTGGAEATRDRTARQRTRVVTAPCAPGMFRTSVSSVAAQGNGRRTFALNGLWVKDPCRVFH